LQVQQLPVAQFSQTTIRPSAHQRVQISLVTDLLTSFAHLKVQIKVGRMASRTHHLKVQINLATHGVAGCTHQTAQIKVGALTSFGVTHQRVQISLVTGPAMPMAHQRVQSNLATILAPAIHQRVNS
jgi:hypothetical protein